MYTAYWGIDRGCPRRLEHEKPDLYNNQVHGCCNIAVQACYFIIPWQHVQSGMNMAVDLSWWFQQRVQVYSFIKPWTVCSKLHEQACQQPCLRMASSTMFKLASSTMFKLGSSTMFKLASSTMFKLASSTQLNHV